MIKRFIGDPCLHRMKKKSWDDPRSVRNKCMSRGQSERVKTGKNSNKLDELSIMTVGTCMGFDMI